MWWIENIKIRAIGNLHTSIPVKSIIGNIEFRQILCASMQYLEISHTFT